MFFVDLPNQKEREGILSIMNARYGTSHDTAMSGQMEGWTGAEIEKFCVSSLYDGDREAFAQIKPIYLQNREKIEKAREWARFNARLASGNGQEACEAGRRLKI